jgi:type IV pilus assembly protein PilY1
MGRGGYGYFALDITNPNSPSFLFAFQNDPTNMNIYHWDANGKVTELGYTSGILAEYDYSKLGETWSTPVIMAIPYDNVTKSNNTEKRRWVAVFGAGYNSGVNTEYGSAVYVIDLEDNGKVLKRIDLSESTDKNGVVINNSIANSVPADLTVITPDTTDKANYKGGMFYFADLEGKFWKLNLTDKGTLYEVTQIFNAEATQENDRMAFFQVTPSIGNDGNLWMYYGTGNQQKLQRMSSSIKNRIYGFKDANFPKFKAVSSSTITSLKNNTSTGGICPTSADLGWYVDLDAHEKVTGKLALSNETVFASRYTPNNKNICNPGDSKLTEHDFACGNTLRGTKLGKGISTGAVIYKGRVYIGISGSGSEDIKDEKGNVIGQRKDNLIVFTPKQGSKGKGSVSYESWREVF